MARYGKWNKFLTGERLEIYKRNLVVDGTLGLLFAVIIIILNNYSSYTKELLLGWGLYIIFLVIGTWFMYRFTKKQTVWQLRQQELNIGQKEALDILKGLNVRVKNGN